MKNFNLYREYEIEQWLEDVDFVRWVKKPTEESNAFFTGLMAKDAQQAQKMAAAVQILQGIESNEPTLSDESVSEIWENIESKTTRRRNLNYWVRPFSVAASIFLVVGLASYLFFGISRDVDYRTIAARVSVDSISEIRLLLSDKSQITLSNRAEVVLGNNGEMTLHSSKGDHVTLNRNEFSEKQFGQLIVPKGKRASMIFADGSRITVRPGSKVVFPTLFGQKQREIYLQGEAFLEVSKNKKRPFIVKTELMNVQVLGTSFDVCAYPEQNKQSVVLVTGSVKVRSGSNAETKIIPNQRYSFDKTNQIQSVDEVDVFPYISWKDGILSFNSENLGLVLDKLSSYYGVKFDYERNALSEIHLTGKLDLNNDVDEALKVIASISQIQYVHMKKSIKINVKP
jgi:transmembrane sensor